MLKFIRSSSSSILRSMEVACEQGHNAARGLPVMMTMNKQFVGALQPYPVTFPAYNCNNNSNDDDNNNKG